MERDGEHGIGALAQFLELRGDTGGGDGDTAPADGNAVAVANRVDGGRHVVEIVERLAHAHEDDIGEAAVFGRGRPFAECVAGDHDLRGDLLRGEIAHEGLCAGMAEGAVERAADLGGHAEPSTPGAKRASHFCVPSFETW